MAKTTDWLRSDRQGQLDMCLAWIKVLREQAEQGKGTKADAWSIPQSAVEELETLAEKAAAALAAAKNEETRTAVTNTQCRVAFEALVAKMRDCKRRFFHVPPLTEADLVSLWLKARDTSPTVYGDADGVVAVEVYLRNIHELGVRYRLVSGNPDNPANRERMVWYKAVAHGETPPEHPAELTLSFSTRRKQDKIPFDYGDSGKTAYMAVQTGKGTKKGPWGPMISAVIP